MRLTCPNCGAQYEVPDEVIPESGRDVQCSNCGETWFQAHPDQAAPEAAREYDLADTGDDVNGQDWPDPDEDTGPAPDQDIPREPAGRRELDPDTASLLREEAAREAQARAAEARGGLETQPDLGLTDPQDDADQRSHQTRARMERLQGTAAPQSELGEDDDFGPGSRRDLLPDIDEINSTIASETMSDSHDLSARDGSKVAAQPNGSSFGRGVRMAILLALVATAIYLFAPRIADTVPAMAGPLAAYVAAVDSLRAMLNDQVAGLLSQL